MIVLNHYAVEATCFNIMMVQFNTMMIQHYDSSDRERKRHKTKDRERNKRETRQESRLVHQARMIRMIEKYKRIGKYTNTQIFNTYLHRFLQYIQPA